jgi:hypothetical protein
MWGSEPSHSQVNSHVGSWSPERTPESLKRNCTGQNSSPRRVLYIIGKLLKCRCLKWARMAHFVATLALGSWPRQRGCKGAGQEEARSHITYSRECKKVWGSEPSHSQVNSHVGSWSFERTPESLERDCRGQNSLPRGVLYIIRKQLKRRCLKWDRMAHLNIWNTSYGQKKGRESNWQFDSQSLKVGNRPDLLGCRQRATYRWKALDESYNFASDCTSIRGLLAKLWDSKVPGVPVGGISRLPRGSPGREKPFGCRPRGEAQSIL